jgi:hypothetical protein
MSDPTNTASQAELFRCRKRLIGTRREMAYDVGDEHGRQRRSQQFVAYHWLVIEALARALLAKEWGPLKPLNSGAEWSKAEQAKRLSGEEVVAELKRYDIDAICEEEC